jgi:hypothetical protein
VKRRAVRSIGVVRITLIASVLGLVGPVGVTAVWLWNSQATILDFYRVILLLWPTQIVMLAAQRADRAGTIVVWCISALSNVVIYTVGGFVIGLILRVASRETRLPTS